MMNLNKLYYSRLTLIILLTMVLNACVILEPKPVSSVEEEPIPLIVRDSTTTRDYPLKKQSELQVTLDDTTSDKPIYYPGTGRFIKPPKHPSPVQKNKPLRRGAKLNFEEANLLEVIKVIMGDMLGKSYILDPAVRGSVTFQSSGELQADDLLPIMETLLRMNGMAMSYVNGIYRIMPISKAQKFGLIPQVGGFGKPIPSGFLVKAIPLKYIAVNEMAAILKPMTPNNSIIRIDPLRNLMLIAGTSDEVSRLFETIQMFDVDWMAGLSVGIYPLKFVKAKDMLNSLNSVLSSSKGKNIALDGLLRFVPIEGSNSIMVVTPQKHYLTKVKEWIERLDLAGGDLTTEDEERLYVYRVVNGDAEELSSLLNELFGNKKRSKSKTAPNRKPSRISSRNKKQPKNTFKRTKKSKSGLSISNIDVRIVADKANNSLLISSTPHDFKMIQNALTQLDIVPLQVLIEAKIYEVTLSDDLKYGLQWFFNSGKGTYDNSIGTLGGNVVTDFNQAVNTGLSGIKDAFNFALINNAGSIRAIFNAIASKSLLKVISAPSVMVLDNHSAKIQVGDQVPIAVGQQQSTAVNSTILNTIEYRDTGVVLDVTPRVNPGGLVVMDISQEVSNVREQKSGGVDSPTISTRNISSTVAVRDNQSIVLGGLIRSNGNNTSSGVPFLHDIPILGTLFGSKSDTDSRTELVIVITPKIIFNEDDMTRITNDYKGSMKRLESAFNKK